jgi:hypothetical protein
MTFHGWLDTYYVHFWLQLHDSNPLEAGVEDLLEDIRFESNMIAYYQWRVQLLKIKVGCLEKYLKEKSERKIIMRMWKSSLSAVKIILHGDEGTNIFEKL